MTTFNWQGCFAPLLDDLDSRGLERWRKQLQQQLQKRFDDNPHGDIARWNRALDTLPHIGDATANLNQSAITLNSDQPLRTENRAKLEEGLRGLMPGNGTASLPTCQT
jgi:tRNA (mo5U34)-methyltransferase